MIAGPILARKMHGQACPVVPVFRSAVKSFLIISPELQLRLLRSGQAGILYALVDRNRDHLRRWLPWVDSTRSPADSHRFLEANEESFQDGRGFTLGIHWKSQLAGAIGFHGFDRSNRITSLGYWLGAEYCGRGIMRRSVANCVDMAIREEGMNRVYLRCGTGNRASKRIPQALGFRFEGIQREAEWLYDHYVDLEVYSMLASEWMGPPEGW